jgi:hypothetical protein
LHHCRHAEQFDDLAKAHEAEQVKSLFPLRHEPVVAAVEQELLRNR